MIWQGMFHRSPENGQGYPTNGEEVARIRDDTFTEEGSFGFYVPAGIEGTENLPLVVRFDDLAYWDLDKPK